MDSIMFTTEGQKKIRGNEIYPNAPDSSNQSTKTKKRENWKEKERNFVERVQNDADTIEKLHKQIEELKEENETLRKENKTLQLEVAWLSCNPTRPSFLNGAASTGNKYLIQLE